MGCVRFGIKMANHVHILQEVNKEAESLCPQIVVLAFEVSPKQSTF